LIPGDMRATFFGMQSAAANLLAAAGAVLAGVILSKIAATYNFAVSFACAVVLYIFSWFALSLAREPDRAPVQLPYARLPFWDNIVAILKADKNFRAFLITRMVTQFAAMASAFYTVYAVRVHGMDVFMAGVMTSVLLITQTLANPVLGWAADRWTRKGVLAMGAAAMGLSALLAWFSPSLYWFVPVFILSGIGGTAYWTVGIALTLEFGEEHERPTYVGMANTLIVPATIIAPFLGGLLADSAGYGAAFFVSGVAGLLAAVLLARYVKDPVRS
jgi:MFS family permease